MELSVSFARVRDVFAGLGWAFWRSKIGGPGDEGDDYEERRASVMPRLCRPCVAFLGIGFGLRYCCQLGCSPAILQTCRPADLNDAPCAAG